MIVSSVWRWFQALTRSCCALCGAVHVSDGRDTISMILILIYSMLITQFSVQGAVKSECWPVLVYLRLHRFRNIFFFFCCSAYLKVHVQTLPELLNSSHRLLQTACHHAVKVWYEGCVITPEDRCGRLLYVDFEFRTCCNRSGSSPRMSSALTPSSEPITTFVYISFWVEDSASHINITLNLTLSFKDVYI